MKTIPEFTDEELKLHCYNLPQRQTSKQLVRSFIRDIRKAKEEFDLRVFDASYKLKNNFERAFQMDQLLGAPSDDFSSSDSDEDWNTRTQKDGTKKLRCPIMHCKVKTFKLRRHITTVHSKLSDQIDYATKMSLLIEKEG